MYYPDIENVTTNLPTELFIHIEKGLNLWKNNYESFDTYIFSIFFTEQELTELWENLRNDIALYFQSNLEKEIELWNIYIIFFIENSIVQKELKYKVENDYYCARKLVIDNVGEIKDNEEKIKAEINKKLFGLEILESTTARNIDELEKEINLIDSRLTNLSQINNLINNYKD